MAHNVEGFRIPAVAASAIAQYVPVRFVGDPNVSGGSALSETVVRAGSINEAAFGMTTASAPTYGVEISVQVDGVTKGVAGASMGAGARLGVGSTNGILIPLGASGAASVANYPLRYAIGWALKNAAAGDFFPVLIDPDQII